MDSGFSETQHLALHGKVPCRGPCKRQLPLDDVITLQYGKAIVFSICPECFLKVDVVMARSVDGIRVEMRPRGIVVVG